MRSLMILVGVVVTAAACANLCKGPAKPAAGEAITEAAKSDASATTEATASIPDTKLGLSKTSVFETPSPAAYHPVGGEPGDNERLPRAYAIAPPVIPHSVEGLLPITREENQCLDCHELGESEEGDPPALPPSHATDLRYAPGEVGEAVVGARWRCVACHVPRTDAEPLVGNTFGG